MTFADKTIWITGASSGIGEALAHVLAARGAKLVLSSRRQEVLESVRSVLARPDAHLIAPIDMQDATTFGPAVDVVLGKFGCVDGLIHSAGISHRGIAVDTTMEVDRQLMEANYLGPVALSKLVLPSMIERRSGHIVVISSLLGKFGVRERSAYCGSKHALHGFFESLRAELFHYNIDVTLVCPGFVRTNVSINALTADGTAHGRMDKAIRDGLSPQKCATKIAAAIECRKREVYIGKRERFGVYIHRFVPALFSRIARNTTVR